MKSHFAQVIHGSDTLLWQMSRIQKLEVLSNHGINVNKALYLIYVSLFSI